jgi:hypothetical protein
MNIRAIRFALLGVVLVLLLGVVPAASQTARIHQPDVSPDVISRLFGSHRFGTTAAVTNSFELVGHNDLGGGIDYGDIFGHGDFAYVGTRCGVAPPYRGGRGVQVVDISDPTAPTVVATLGNPKWTRAEDVVVRDVHTPWFSGALAAVGIQGCFGSGQRNQVFTGLEFFDVTYPRHPAQLGSWRLPLHRMGCHEIDLVQRADGMVLAGCAHNLYDQALTSSPAVEFVDVSDPSRPRTVSQFRDPVNVFSGVGCDPLSFDHSVRFEDHGQVAYLSYWDAGTKRLDISDPTHPKEVETVKISPPDEDGSQHSMTLARDGRWLLINPEDFSSQDCPDDPRWVGGGEVWVYANTSIPHYVGQFFTPNTHSKRKDGIFTAHNTEVVGGDQFFSSWYSDGLVWWTMDQNGIAHMKGQFVPPAGPEGPPLMWGVYPEPQKGLVLGSDILTGLWIVRPVGS